MTAIAGIVGPFSAEHPLNLEQMLRAMLHEPTWRSETYVNESVGFCGGWVERSPAPEPRAVWNTRGDIGLILAGEDYGEHKGNILRIYEKLGPGFLLHLNGSFCGVLMDLRERQVMLFNDRYGLGRVYYHERDGRLYFASEAKALLKVLPDLRRLEPSTLGEMISFDCVLRNRTLFPGISLLPAGSVWTFNVGKAAHKNVYFTPKQWESLPPLPYDDYYERLKTLFPRVLDRYLKGHENVGMSLTGGLDGRMIMAWLRRSEGSLPCYTFGGTYRECNDVKLARRVATLCHQPHSVIPVDAKFFPEFPILSERAAYLSDGTMDVSGAVDLYVNRIAKQISPIRLTGNYGSEVLRGNVAFKPGRLHQGLFDNSLQPAIQEAASTYADELQGRELSFIAFKQVPWHHYSRLALERTELTVRTPFLDNDLVALQYQAPVEGHKHNVSMRLIADGNPLLASVPTDRGLSWDSVPVWSRLQNLYQEFTFKAEYAYDYGMPQWMAQVNRKLERLRLERLFLGRHKFYHFRMWYRNPLAPYVKAILLDHRTLSRPFLNRRRLENIVSQHTSGTANYTREIHRVLTLELMCRKLID